ncbi:MAG: hypothetical protein IKO41_16035 [Lachnospiraceae bacterium]|nr:hypothetical protein [Lachnospiraceae bacterium]
MRIDYNIFTYSRAEMLDVLTIYKIPIDNCEKYVFMRPIYELKDSCTPIIASSKLFRAFWGDRENKEDFSKDYKLLHSNLHLMFEGSDKNPIEISLIDSFYKNYFFIKDGKTRLIYLLLHNAKSIPLMCPNEILDTAIKLISPIKYDNKFWTVIN